MTTETDLEAAQAANATSLAKFTAALALIGNDNSGAGSASGAPNDAAAKDNLVASVFAQTALGESLTALATDLNPPPVIVPPPPVTSTALLGLFVPNQQLASAQTLATELGMGTLKALSMYTTGTTWGTIGGWTPPKVPAGTTILLGVDLDPNNTGLNAVPANLATFEKLATDLIGTDVIPRLGWELDGSWMPWGTGANGNTPAEFAAACNAVIPAMKAKNPALKFDFCNNGGTSTEAQLEIYYGAQNNWDFVGCDHYDNVGGGGNVSQLAASVALAVKEGKPLSCGEWGLNGTDDPTFITDMLEVFLNPTAAAKAFGWAAYTPGYASYFSDDLQINSDITQFPKSMAAFKAALA